MIARDWKNILYVINGISFLVSVGIIVLAILQMVNSKVVVVAFFPKWVLPLILVIGVVMLSVVTCGWRGTFFAEEYIEKQENNTWLIVYSIVVFIILSLKIATFAGAAYYSKVEEKPDSFLGDQIKLLPKSQWENIQDTLECCGFSPKYYNLATSTRYCDYNNATNATVIPSSIRNNITNAIPCKAKIIDIIDSNALLIMIVCIFAIFVSLTAFISSLVLGCCRVKTKANHAPI